MAKTHHPDRGGCAELYDIITKAYNVLNDDVKRKEYDNKLLQATYNSHFALKKEFMSKMAAIARDENVQQSDNNSNNEKMLSKKIVESKMEKGDMMNELRNLKMVREQDDIEFEQNAQLNDSSTSALTDKKSVVEIDDDNFIELAAYDKQQDDNDDAFEGNTLFTSVNYKQSVKKNMKKYNNFQNCDINDSYNKELKQRENIKH